MAAGCLSGGDYWTRASDLLRVVASAPFFFFLKIFKSEEPTCSICVCGCLCGQICCHVNSVSKFAPQIKESGIPL